MQKQAEEINFYFTDAAKLYAFENNEAAGLAALTAAKTAAREQRNSMVDYATGFASDISNHDSDAAKRLLVLAAMINEKDWSVRDSIDSKNELETVDKGMVNALDKADGQYFRKNFPEFFKNW